jgi:hypothetical protein
MSKTILYVVIGIVAVTLLLIGYNTLSPTLGGLVHNAIEQFSQGIMVGDAQTPACIKVMDTDKGGWSYITFLNGVQTVTGGSASALATNSWVIPSACTNASTIQGR